MPRRRSKTAAPVNKSQDLPLQDKDAYEFQDLLRDLLAGQSQISNASVYGNNGQSQDGVDVVGRPLYSANGTISVHTVIQAKHVKSFGPSLIRAAAKEFTDSWETVWRNQGVKKYILAVSCRLEQTKRQQAISELIIAFKSLGVEFETWTPDTITRLAARQPTIVAHHFGEDWARRICGAKFSPPTLNNLGTNEQPRYVPVSAQLEMNSQFGETQRNRIRDIGNSGNLKGALSELNHLRQSDQWNLLSGDDKSRLLRLGALFAISGDADNDDIQRLLKDAEEISGSPAPPHILAKFQARMGNWQEALKLARADEGFECQSLLARMELGQSNIEQAASVIDRIQTSNELERGILASLEAELLYCRGEVTEAIDRIKPIAEASNASIYDRFLYARLLCLSAVDFIDRPPLLPYEPQPIESYWVAEIDKNAATVEQALAVFDACLGADGIAPTFQQTLTLWRWFCVALLPGREAEFQEGIEDYLAQNRTHSEAIALAMWSGGLSSELRLRIIKALEDITIENKASRLQIIALVALYKIKGKLEKARTLLAERKASFDEHGYWQLWCVWALQCGLELPSDELQKANIGEARASYLMLISKPEFDGVELEGILKKAAKDGDADTLISVVEIAFDNRSYQAIIPIRHEYLEARSTARSLEVVCVALFYEDEFEQVVETIGKWSNIARSVNVKRVFAEALLRLGRDFEAAAIVQEIAEETKDPNDVLGLANLTAGKLGNVGAAQHIANKIPSDSRLNWRATLQLSQRMMPYDPSLAQRLFSQIDVDDLSDPEAVETVHAAALQIGHTKIIESTASQMQQLFATGKNRLVQQIDVGQISEFLEDLDRRHADRWTEIINCQRPLYRSVLSSDLVDGYFWVGEEAQKYRDQFIQRPLFGRFGGRCWEDDLVPQGVKSIVLDLSTILVAHDLGILSILKQEFEQIFVGNSMFEALQWLHAQIERPLKDGQRGAKKFLSWASYRQVEESEPSEQTLDVVFENALPGKSISISQLIASLVGARSFSETKYQELKRKFPSIEWDEPPAQAAISDKRTMVLRYDVGWLLCAMDVLEVVQKQYDVRFSRSAVEYADRFICRSEGLVYREQRLSQIIDWLRSELADGRIQKLPMASKERSNEILWWLLEEVLEKIPEQAALACDERFVNSFPGLPTGAIFDVVDLMQRLRSTGAISEHEFYEKIRLLRSGGYRYVPILPGELEYWIDLTGFDGELANEPEPMKAIRRYWAKCRTETDILLIGDRSGLAHSGRVEAHFLANSYVNIMDVAQNSWIHYSDKRAEDLCSYIFANLIGWKPMPTISEAGKDADEISQGYMLLLASHLSEWLMWWSDKAKCEGLEKYGVWLFEHYAQPIKDNRLRVYDHFIEAFSQLLLKHFGEFPEAAEEQGSDASEKEIAEAFQRLAIRFLFSLPVDLREDLIKTSSIASYLSGRVCVQRYIGGRVFEATEVDKILMQVGRDAGQAQVYSSEGKLYAVSPEFDESGLLQALHFEGKSEANDDFRLNGDAVTLLHLKGSAKRDYLQQVLIAHDWRDDTLSVQMENVLSLADDLEQFRYEVSLLSSEESYGTWLQETKDRALARDETFHANQLVPNNVEMVLRYFGLDVDVDLVDFPRISSQQLLKGLGASEVACRLFGVPVDISQTAQLQNCDDWTGVLELIEQDEAALYLFVPLLGFLERKQSRRLIARFVKSLEDPDIFLRRLMDHTILVLFIERLFKTHEEVKEWSDDLRWLVSWLHAGQIIRYLGLPQADFTSGIAKQVGRFRAKHLECQTSVDYSCLDAMAFTHQRYALGLCSSICNMPHTTKKQKKAIAGFVNELSIIEAGDNKYPSPAVVYQVPKHVPKSFYIEHSPTEFFTSQGMTAQAEAVDLDVLAGKLMGELGEGGLDATVLLAFVSGFDPFNLVEGINQALVSSFQTLNIPAYIRDEPSKGAQLLRLVTTRLSKDQLSQILGSLKDAYATYFSPALSEYHISAIWQFMQFAAIYDGDNWPALVEEWLLEAIGGDAGIIEQALFAIDFSLRECDASRVASLDNLRTKLLARL